MRVSVKEGEGEGEGEGGGGVKVGRQHKTTQDYKAKRNGLQLSRPTFSLPLFSFALVTTLFASSPTPIFICLLDWCFLFFSFMSLNVVNSPHLLLISRFVLLCNNFLVLVYFFFFLVVARRQRRTFRPLLYGWNVKANGKAWCRHQAKDVP